MKLVIIVIWDSGSKQTIAVSKLLFKLAFMKRRLKFGNAALTNFIHV